MLLIKSRHPPGRCFMSCVLGAGGACWRQAGRLIGHLVRCGWDPALLLPAPVATALPGLDPGGVMGPPYSWLNTSRIFRGPSCWSFFSQFEKCTDCWGDADCQWSEPHLDPSSCSAWGNQSAQQVSMILMVFFSVFSFFFWLLSLHVEVSGQGSNPGLPLQSALQLWQPQIPYHRRTSMACCFTRFLYI